MTTAADEDRAGREHAGDMDRAEDWVDVPTCTRPMLPRFPGQRYRDTCGGLIRDGMCGECGLPERTKP